MEPYQKNFSTLTHKIADANTAISFGRGVLEGYSGVATLRQKVVGFLAEMRDDGNFKPVLAMASFYLEKCGDDQGIYKIEQETFRLQKFEAKAIQIANTALKPAQEKIRAGRFWDAKAEAEKAIDEGVSRRRRAPMGFEPAVRTSWAARSEISGAVLRASTVPSHGDGLVRTRHLRTTSSLDEQAPRSSTGPR